MPSFVHLHSHTQFSLLDGAASIGKMYKKAVADGMKGLAITDHGNMFGVFQFVAEAAKYNKPGQSEVIKPIVGCEFYLVEDRFQKTFTKEHRDKRYHQLMLAKNAEGYKNLSRLCSLGYIDGLYGKYPRIDKKLIEQYKDGLIATTCCLGAEVPQAILNKGEEAARPLFEWWLDRFGEDYYVELQRHHLPEQERVNEVLIRFAEEYKVKMIATNDSHYVDQSDFNAHDILLCINTGQLQKTPASREFGDEEMGEKGKRFAFANDQFFFKSTAEMNELFKDIPEAIDNTNEVLDKIESLKLKTDILLPNFKIPDTFSDQDAYLEHITFEGARKRYQEISPEIEERLRFELNTIKIMGFAGYFLIVGDFIQAGRDMGVMVGPGRGSAAGSAVAYCIGITNIDPIKYNLLFERFLNPERKSMPDIDTDFDDRGREKVIDYVAQKYGREQVAQIVTYGTMAAKMSIKDVARVLDLPLERSNALAKLVPEKPNIKLGRVLHAPLTGSDQALSMKEGLGKDMLDQVESIRKQYESDSLESKVLREAELLEGSVRNTGIHAAGIIIAPKNLMDILPVFTAKDSPFLVTQFEGKVIEDAGVIKMDFLGLKNLTIIKDALELIEENHGIKIDIDGIPLDDVKTYELYQKGDTAGTFQFESPGMQKYLRALKPDQFEDLIAMNALYRPGPMEFIDDYIARKHGKQAVTYAIPEMETILKETFGITVYQEQVMLLSQIIAGFSKGEADGLRKAMGKKQRDIIEKMKERFVEGGTAKGYDAATLEKIYKTWEQFGEYAFNKSHSTCYAFVAYQTAWLKANYPAEYMAALLSNQNNVSSISDYMAESIKMGIPVKGPDVNESALRFSVNKKGEIRFALSALKGVGEAAVEEIVRERKNGAYKNIFDFSARINLRTVNKRCFESLALAGAFDSFSNTRAQFFEVGKEKLSLIDKAIRYGMQEQAGKSSMQQSLFGGGSFGGSVYPEVAPVEEWPLTEKLRKEKEVIGLYLSAYPLDDYQLEIQQFCNTNISEMEELKNTELRFVGLVSSTHTKTAKNGNLYATFVLEDQEGSREFALFGTDYLRFRTYIETPGTMLYLSGQYGQWKKDGRPDDKWYFNFSKMELLSELREKVTKSVTVTLYAPHITRQFVDEIKQLCHLHPGEIPLLFRLIWPENNINLRLQSEIKIQLSAEMLRNFSVNFPELKFSLDN